MARIEATLQDILRLLPELDELEGLRASLVGAARPDPVRQPFRSSPSPAADGRLVSIASTQQAVDEAERVLHERVDRLFAGLRPVLAAFWSGDERKAAQALITLGEQHEAEGRLASARRCLERALELAVALGERGPRILALRRLGRVARGLGELSEAAARYEESLQLALLADDEPGAVIAGTGVGNVLAMQGRFAEAEATYRAALDRAERAAGQGGLALETAQLFNNLAMVAARQERVPESERWFERARSAWREIDSPEDLAVCLHNHSLLLLRTGRVEEACRELEEAVGIEAGPTTRAAVALDLAECKARLGRMEEADQCGRRAEEFALASGSTYTLGHVYLGLGTLARVRGDAGAEGFFLKALELAHRCDYLLLEAETRMEFALLREARDEADEAIEQLERARDIFVQLGHAPERDRAEAELRRVAARGSRATNLY